MEGHCLRLYLALLEALNFELRHAVFVSEETLRMLKLSSTGQWSTIRPMLDSAVFHLNRNCTSPEPHHHSGLRVLQQQHVQRTKRGGV